MYLQSLVFPSPVADGSCEKTHTDIPLNFVPAITQSTCGGDVLDSCALTVALKICRLFACVLP